MWPELRQSLGQFWAALRDLAWTAFVCALYAVTSLAFDWDEPQGASVPGPSDVDLRTGKPTARVTLSRDQVGEEYPEGVGEVLE